MRCSLIWSALIFFGFFFWTAEKPSCQEKNKEDSPKVEKKLPLAEKDPAKGQPKLDPTNYRLKVETILEPIGKVAIYRVQIWTTENREVYLDWVGRQGGLLRRVKGEKHFRADFVLFACVRDPNPPGGKTQLEFRILIGGAKGMTNMSEDTEKSTQLSKLFEFPAADGVHKLGHTERIGRFRDKAVEIGVRELQPEKK